MGEIGLTIILEKTFQCHLYVVCGVIIQLLETILSPPYNMVGKGKETMGFKSKEGGTLNSKRCKTKHKIVLFRAKKYHYSP